MQQNGVLKTLDKTTEKRQDYKKETLNNALIKCVNGCKEWKKHLRKNNWMTDTDIYN